MTNSTPQKIEFYKIRSITDCLSAAVSFIQSNLKAIFKNVFKIGLPIALIQAYFMNNYMDFSLLVGYQNPSTFLVSSIGLFVTVLLGMVLLYSTLGNIFLLYERDELDKNTKVGDLKELVPFSIRTFLVLLVIGILFFLMAFLTGMTQIVALIVLLLFIVIALIPSFSLLLYPIYFESAGIWETVIKSVRTSFRYWGSTFLIFLIASILTGILQYIFILPTYVIVFLKILMRESDMLFIFDIIGYLCSLVSSLGSITGYTVFFIFMAFQYFNIREKEEGISLKAKIANFDQL